MCWLKVRQFKCLCCEKLVYVYANLCTCSNNKALSEIFIKINKSNALTCSAQICVCHTRE